jgi:signal transduction histidine kinase
LLQEIEDRKHLEEELLNIIERERRHVGEELHDSIGQQLVGIEFMSEVLEGKLSGKSLPEASYAAKITRRVGQATDQARSLAKGLHPVDLETRGLTSALRELSETTKDLFDISCTFKCDESVLVGDTVAAINIYRIAQEAITNAIRHGKSKNILVELSFGEGLSTLTVKSDGLDFPGMQAKSKGMGLKIMDHRAEMIGGSLDICKCDSGGTIVTCVFPSKNTNNKAGGNYGS